MFKKCYSLSLFLLLFLLADVVVAQDAAVLDVIRLRSGTMVTGVITEYKANDYVVVRKSDTGLLGRYPMEAVVNIYQSDGEEQEEYILPMLVKPEMVSTIEMKDGTSYEGEITSYDGEGQLRVELASGTAVYLDDEAVDHVTYQVPEGYGKNTTEEEIAEILKNQQQAVKKLAPKPPYEFRERGWFNATSFSFSFGAREAVRDDIVDPFFGPTQSSRSSIGFNVQHVVGYQFKRMLGLGLGVSYDAYDLEDGESILGVFAHYRGYLKPTNVSPFLGLSAGYGFALENSGQGIIEARGGWMVHPEVGVRLGASSKANFTFALGYRLQDAYYVQEFPFSGNIEYRNLIYRRMLFSLGMVF